MARPLLTLTDADRQFGRTIALHMTYFQVVICTKMASRDKKPHFFMHTTIRQAPAGPSAAYPALTWEARIGTRFVHLFQESLTE
jgi:hypothetical protein